MKLPELAPKAKSPNRKPDHRPPAFITRGSWPFKSVLWSPKNSSFSECDPEIAIYSQSPHNAVECRSSWHHPSQTEPAYTQHPPCTGSSHPEVHLGSINPHRPPPGLLRVALANANPRWTLSIGLEIIMPPAMMPANSPLQTD